ncbi:hypothetical protein AN403_5261 [Pseudomonas fluorescens]|uniref:Secreted protein n=1 Tax=Pseudomonas fluorescens TaxID=294 RepID=A0A0P8XL15_PSEFL|nr:hypothetical protein AN403_5261 [Pseudomonas fluorescens]
MLLMAMLMSCIFAPLKALITFRNDDLLDNEFAQASILDHFCIAMHKCLGSLDECFLRQHRDASEQCRPILIDVLEGQVFHCNRPVSTHS